MTSPETLGSTPHARHAQRTGAGERLTVVRPRPLVTLGAVLTGLLLAAAAASGERLVEVGVVVAAGLVVAAGWPRLVGSPTPVGSAIVLAVTVAALGGALLATESEPFLEQVPAAVAAGIIAMCLHPLVQESARAQLTQGLTGTGLGVLVIACGGVLTSAVPNGGNPVLVLGVALAIAALVDLATERPRSAAWMLPVGMLVGGLAAEGVHAFLDGALAPWPALLGVVGAGVALSLRRVTAQQPAVDSIPGALAAGVASVLVVGPLVHLVSRLPLG